MWKADGGPARQEEGGVTVDIQATDGWWLALASSCGAGGYELEVDPTELVVGREV